MCIRPVMTYASPVFVHAKPDTLCDLQVVQNKFCRRAADTPWYVKNSVLHQDIELPIISKFMKDASEWFFDIASNHPNPLLVSAVSYGSPPPYHFCRRPRNVLLDPPDNLTVETEKLIEGSHAPTASPCRIGRVLDEGVKALGSRHCSHKLFRRFLVLASRTHLCARSHGRPIIENNFKVPANIDCTILIYDLHRRSDQFAEPLKFQPERFAGPPTWHPYAYIPFSAGPRNCIGQKFAMIEMKLAVSAVLRRFSLKPVTRPQDVVFTTDFILRAKHPIYVKLEQRE
ncbi:Probable cytochrome P450 4ac3 [Eumeta japonica]|uniref:Probable cytochrome P450 4ac3 n=1 Tax=Eumeta variegata TaxID=151549 RepID=A0A4C1UQB9_EUMVA|nr:Probable cytochrome P450 4ac3 [Eumeta japonica]